MQQNISKLPLFKNMMPFGGKLDESNRWLIYCKLIPWEKLVSLHDSYFTRKNSIKDGRLVIGLTLGKFYTGLSDRKIVEYFYENPYFQYFCGYDVFVTPAMSKVLDHSLLSRRRKLLGKKYFSKLESEIFNILKSHKLVKGNKLLIDATVFNSNISYPNDVKLLNHVREWSCDKIKKLSKLLELKSYVRTYCRKAKQCYLNFAKSKKKTISKIRKSRKSMLQFVRRNLSQLDSLVSKGISKLSSDNFTLGLSDNLKDLFILIKEISPKLITGNIIYSQQHKMHVENLRTVPDRIVNFAQDFVRAMPRGKESHATEFGAKAHIAMVDGFAVIDKVEHRNFSENNYLKESLEHHMSKFGKYPKQALMDDIYSSNANKTLLDSLSIEHCLKFRGNVQDKKKIYKKRRMRKERSKVEGLIGNLKKDYSAKLITLKIKEGAEIQARIAASLFNLHKASKIIV